MNHQLIKRVKIQKIINLLLKYTYLFLIPLIISIICFNILDISYVQFYKAKATIYININEIKNSIDQNILISNINDFSELVKSKHVINEVISRLPNEVLTYNGIEKSISISSLNDMKTVNITVIGVNPKQVELVAITTREVSSLKAIEIMMIDTYIQTDDTELIIEPLPSNVINYTILSGIISLVFTLFIILFLGFLDKKRNKKNIYTVKR